MATATALVSDDGPSCTPPDHLRICKPSTCDHPHEFPSREEDTESRSHLLHKIHTSYLESRKRLPERMKKRRVGMAATALRFLCVGLLDPASNIVINNLIVINSGNRSPRDDDDDALRDDRRRRREEALRRSLDCMVTFLTRLFPDLTGCQAVRYLRLADADVLVAARAVVSDSGTKRFDDSEPAVIDMALKCAALAAGHPDADRLVRAWRNISSRIHDATRLLASRSSSSFSKLARMVNERRRPGHGDVWCAWRHAASRRRPLRRRSSSGSTAPPPPPHYQHTGLLKRTLQDAIHGFYLQALARLPPPPAGARLHRSMLKAGHCYGPLDPVSNIIVNTIWHDAAFPPAMKLDMPMAMIGTRCLHRIENRSLYGMASFLCTRYHRVDFHQAVLRLVLQLQDEAHPQQQQQQQDDDPPEPGMSLEEAWLAAATAACHPNPAAQVKLLTSCSKAAATLDSVVDKQQLSTRDVERLAAMLLQISSAPGGGEPASSSSSSSSRHDYALLPALPLEGYLGNVAYLHTEISNKIRALLNAYEQLPNGPAQTRCLYCEDVGTRIVHPVGTDFTGRESEFEKMVCGKDPGGGGYYPGEPLRYTNLNIISHRTYLADNVYRWEKEDSLYDGLDDGHIIRDEYDRYVASMIASGNADDIMPYVICEG